MFYSNRTQIHNQRGAEGENPPRNIFAPSGKMCWTSFKTIGHSSENVGPLRKLFTPPAVPSWLGAWVCHR